MSETFTYPFTSQEKRAKLARSATTIAGALKTAVKNALEPI